MSLKTLVDFLFNHLARLVDREELITFGRRGKFRSFIENFYLPVIFVPFLIISVLYFS